MKILAVGFALLSIFASIVFILAGLAMSFGPGTPPGIRAFGIIPIAYGLATIYILFAAWRYPTSLAQKTSLFLSILVFLIAIGSSMDGGSVVGLEWVGIFIVALMAGVNWFSVNRIIKFAQQGGAADAATMRPRG